MEKRVSEEGVSKKVTLPTKEEGVSEGLVDPFSLPEFADFFEGCDEEVWDDDHDDIYPDGTLKHERPDFDLILSRYGLQYRQTKGFEIYDYPGGVVRIQPLLDFSTRIDLLMELAHQAVDEYNEKECSAFKYKVLKIEKVNYKFTGHEQYLMTVKVLNVTLGTPIETFQICAAESGRKDKKYIISCWSKEEADVGSAVGLFGQFCFKGT